MITEFWISEASSDFRPEVLPSKQQNVTDVSYFQKSALIHLVKLLYLIIIL